MLAQSITSTSLSSSRSITIQLRLVNSYILHLGFFQQTQFKLHNFAILYLIIINFCLYLLVVPASKRM